VDIFIGLVLIVFGTGLALASAPLAGRVQKSNEAFFGKGAFQGAGWRRWNRAVAILVGSTFALFGLLLLLGILES
jgi:hypothetical protein